MREPHDAKVEFVEIEIGESGCSQTHRPYRQDRSAKNDGDSEHEQAPLWSWQTVTPSQSANDPNRKHKLPRERIEVPAVAAPADAASPGRVNCDGHKKRRSRTARRQKNNDRRPKSIKTT